jgi:hypothetical protein
MAKKIVKKSIKNKVKEIKKENFDHTRIEKAWKKNWDKTKLYID